MSDQNEQTEETSYVVGQRYDPALLVWEEGQAYTYADGGHQLLLAYRNPVEAEVAAVQTGPIELSGGYDQGVVFLLYTFGALMRGDCPYSGFLLPPEQQVPPMLPADWQALLVTLHILLVDATTGIIAASRLELLPADFSRSLHQAILRQIDETPHFDREVYEETVVAIRAQNTVPGFQEARLVLASCSLPARA